MTDGGPLTATNVKIVDTLPAGATFVSASPGCTYASGTVTCVAAGLGANSSQTFNIVVQWTSTGPVYDSASVGADQSNTTAGGGSVSFGLALEDGDAPLPLWSYALPRDSALRPCSAPCCANCPKTVSLTFIR